MARTRKANSATYDGIEDTDNDTIFKNINRRCKVTFRNKSQQTYWETIDNNEITFCIGPAGTGKSYLSLVKALQFISNDFGSTSYKRILCIKPVVESEEKMGALPGDVLDKLDPYIYSTKYLFSKIIGERRVEKLIERKIIDFTALTYLRGVNIDNTILVFDEAQNSSRKGMRTLLTRIGENCKFIISGDVEQIDKDFKHGEESGLTFAIKKLEGVQNIGIFKFKETDIVRNPLIGEVLRRFNGDIK